MSAAAPQPGDDAIEIAAEDLPLYCPNPRMTLWSAHPRVFLDITTHGAISCPYCGTSYRLRPGTVIQGHH